MKGKVTSMVPKEGKNGTYYRVTIESDGSTKEYLAKDASTVNALKDALTKGGDLPDFQAQPSKDGSATWVKVGSGGGFSGGGGYRQPSKDESFALAYAKDVAVAFINKGIIDDGKKADAAILHFFSEFMRLLRPAAQETKKHNDAESDIPF